MPLGTFEIPARVEAPEGELREGGAVQAALGDAALLERYAQQRRRVQAHIMAAERDHGGWREWLAEMDARGSAGWKCCGGSAVEVGTWGEAEGICRSPAYDFGR